MHIVALTVSQDYVFASKLFLPLQFALLESTSVDSDLAELKKELSGSSKVVYFFSPDMIFVDLGCPVFLITLLAIGV